MPDLHTPEPYVLILTGVGLLIALVAWLPLALRRMPLSLPIVCIGIGALVFSLPSVPFPQPTAYPKLIERVSEFVVLVALMGAGLKIDRIFGLRRWSVTWRLLGITMPLSILAITLLGVWGLGLTWVTALLLGAALAPTDPVLASDVQVGPPNVGSRDEVRFGLTSEAGLNDGLAFPFVNLAIALGAWLSTGKPWLQDWLLHDVLWEIAAAIGVGLLVGRAFGWATFHAPGTKLARTGDGLIALSATLVTYGAAEMLNCYGFLAVFVAALALRHSHRDHEFHRDMHDLTEQFERLAMMGVLLLFGGTIAGGLLAPLGWRDVLVALAILLLVRPITGWIGLIGFPLVARERATLAFFGIRGIGSIYYLAYGINHMAVPEASRLWSIIGLIILCSILLHGTTVTPIMRWLDRKRGRDPDALDEIGEDEDGEKEERRETA